MTESLAMTIWGAGTPRSFRPIWTAEELGLTYHHQPIGPRTGETKSQDYTALNPKQKIPYFQDQQVGLSESVAITRYLIEAYGGEIMQLCQDPVERAKEDEWVCYVYGELDETSMYVMRRHGDLQELYGHAEAAVSSSKAYAERHLGIIAEQLGAGPFVMGDQLGIADILLISCLDWAHFYQIDTPQRLKDYRAVIAERPAYQTAYAKNYPQLAS